MKKILSITLAILMVAAAFSFTGLTAFAASEYEILIDGTFEDQNDEVWVKYTTGLIDFEFEGAYEGESCLFVSERTHSTDVVRQYITNELNFYGPGTYQFTAYAKLAEEWDSEIQLQGVVGAYKGTEVKDKVWGTTNFVTLSATEWRAVSGTVEVSWSGELTEGEFYFITNEQDTDSFANLLIDSCSLTKVGYTGDAYTAPTPEPTLEPTPEPTEAPTADPNAATTAPAANNTNAPAGSATAGTDTNTTNEGGSSSVLPIILIVAGVILVGGCVAFVISLKKGKKNEQDK